MEIEFDPAKDVANRKKHGVSLAHAAGMDFGAARVIEDDRIDYGEARFIALGTIGSRVHVLVFTMRGEIVRVISLRKAKPKEVRLYEQG
jgi:uncharacterized DUF497 family protein